ALSMFLLFLEASTNFAIVLPSDSWSLGFSASSAARVAGGADEVEARRSRAGASRWVRSMGSLADSVLRVARGIRRRAGAGQKAQPVPARGERRRRPPERPRTEHRAGAGAESLLERREPEPTRGRLRPRGERAAEVRGRFLGGSRRLEHPGALEPQ